MRTHSTAASSTANTARPEAISTARGKALWRSLDELADTDEFRRWLHHEFPPGSLDHLAGISRRRFLKILAASFALAGGVSCDSGPPRFIVPYVQEPEPIVPGKPLYFATALTRNGYALGVLVESHTGRPTKIEGNIHHPASLGSTDIFAQAELLTLYDPDRSQAAYFRNGINTWDQFARDLAARLGELRARNGRGLYLLTGAISSPTLLRQIQQILDLFPQARWHAYEPVTDENTRLAGRTAFGRDVDLIHRLDRADVIVSLDADFLLESPGRVRYAREFSNRRRARAGEAFDPRTMNRLYVVEPTLTLTGANADHRLPMRASRIGAWARQLARELGLAVPQTGPPQLDEASQRWARVVAQDLQRHPGAGLILVGDAQPADVHVLAHAMNTALGNVGRTILPIEPVAMRAGGEGPPASLIELVEAIDAGEVDTLIILDRNPIYDAPADLRFEERLSRVPFSVHMGLYRDETAQQCLWHLPMTHELESWSDARAFEGTVTILQPLITPLYRGRTAHELMAMLAGETNLTAYQIVRQTWQARAGQGDFESWWQEALRRGVVPDTAAPVLALSPDARAILDAVGSSTVQADEGSSLEITFKPDPTLWDGRYA
ncbi:MAG TPA: TAT-variant-translocated molybdopterin oxidoreductase, partial [Phycisphaeraceae bacterium]